LLCDDKETGQQQKSCTAGLDFWFVTVLDLQTLLKRAPALPHTIGSLLDEIFHGWLVHRPTIGRQI